MSIELIGLEKASPQSRLNALKKLYDHQTRGGKLPPQSIEVNNHVHTCYSFSSYTPAQAAYRAWESGLQALGIMDHDSFSGAEEMIEACRILGLGSTCGVELRVSADETSMKGRNLNNPGCEGIFYIALHAISLRHAKAVGNFLHPIQEARNDRNHRQVKKLNLLLRSYDLNPIDFREDVYNYSMAAFGGSITERHILAALARKLMSTYEPGPVLRHALSEILGISLPPKLEACLLDPKNPHYMYDLLGALKSQFLPAFFIRPDIKECIPVSQAVEFAQSIDAIPAYAYLGDVEESPTGDKKAEKFEDAFLEELIIEIKKWGFLAVTFMPPRNTRTQLKRLMALCDQYELMQISGVDINSSRQAFTCPEMWLPEFWHLGNSTWALSAHEKIGNVRPLTGLFGPNTLANVNFSLKKRIEIYARLGKRLDPHSLDIDDLMTREFSV